MDYNYSIVLSKEMNYTVLVIITELKSRDVDQYIIRIATNLGLTNFL